MRLSSLNPFSLVLGPVFQKEVRSAGRRRGTYVFRALYAGALLALVAMAFISILQMMRYTTGVQRLQTLQELAPSLALSLMWFQFIALALAAPILTGAAICDERRARTLSTLLTTPLTAAQIVWGKLASRVVQLAILALLAAPLLLAIRVFGGLDATLIVATTAISVSTALLGAALGLMYSTWNRRATSAAVFGLLTLVLIQGAPVTIELMLVSALENRAHARGRDSTYHFHTNVLATCSPAVMVWTTRATLMGLPTPVIEFESPASASGPDAGALPTISAPMWAVNTVYNLLMAVGAVLCSTIALRRVMRREGASEGSSVAAPPRKKKSKAASSPDAAPQNGEAPAPAIDPIPETPADLPGREARDISDRPVLWREVRQATFGSRRRLLLVSGLAAAGLLYLYYEWGMGEEGVHQTLAIIGALTVMVQSVFMTTGSIAGEREARTWEVLLSTPLSGRSILLGKTVGALRAQWFVPTFILAHFVLAAVLGYVTPILPLHLLMIYLGPILFFTATGQVYSLIFRKGVTAAACNLFTALMLWAGLWIILLLLAWFGAENDAWFHRIADCLLAINPVAMAPPTCEPAIKGHPGRIVAQVYNFGSLGRSISLVEFTLILLGALAFYTVAAAAVLGAGLAGFRKFSGRSS